MGSTSTTKAGPAGISVASPSLVRVDTIMRPTSGTTTSVWMAATDAPSEKTLDKDLSASVCVVGAGIAGLTTAYLLTRAAKTVIVLDDGPIGGGMTARTR